MSFWSETGADDGSVTGGRYAWADGDATGSTLTQAVTVPAATTTTTYEVTATTVTQTVATTTNAVTSIAFDYAWQNADTRAPNQNVLEVRYKGVVYATFTTGGGNNATGSWAYSNGASGTGGLGASPKSTMRQPAPSRPTPSRSARLSRPRAT